jgi:hypothetical protein
MYTHNLKMLEVNVPIFFFWHSGCSLRRDGRYLILSFEEEWCKEVAHVIYMLGFTGNLTHLHGSSTCQQRFFCSVVAYDITNDLNHFHRDMGAYLCANRASYYIT